MRAVAGRAAGNAKTLRALCAAGGLLFVLVCFFELYPSRLADARSFYCAGQLALAREDPYREHPLHECEHGLAAWGLSSLPQAITVPAPFPAPTLLLFAAFARLPFPAAMCLWLVLLLAATGWTIALCANLTSTSWLGAAIALGFPALIVALPLGQITPVVLLSLVGCATLVQRGRPQLAALAAAGSMLDPHVGLPLVAALFLCLPQTRLILIAVTLAYGAAAAAVGWSIDREYLTGVLPAHALVNVPEASQLSASNLAFTLGLPASTALALGVVWYVGSVIVGIGAAMLLRARWGTCAVALVPPAFAVFGGPHTHLQQLAIAAPAFLMLCRTVTASRARAVAVAATFTAAMPWFVLAPFPVLVPAVALLAILFARTMGVPHVGRGMAIAACSVLIALCIAVLASHRPDAVATLAPVAGNPLAEVAWSRFVAAGSLPAKPWYLLAKLPTYVGCSWLLFAIVVRGLSRPAGIARGSVS